MDFFQPLSLEETFKRVYLVFSRKWAVFSSIMVMAYLLFFAVSIVVVFMLAPYIDYGNGQGYSNTHVVIGTLLDLGIYYAIICIADGAIIRAVAEMYVGQVPTVDSTLQHGLGKMYQLFGNAVVIGAGVGVPAFILLLAMVWITNGAAAGVIVFNAIFLVVMACVVVVTYFTYPAVMVEDAGMVDSIYRSFELTKNHRCHIFSVLTLFFVTKFVLDLACNFTAMAGGGAVGALMQLLKIIISVIFATMGSMYVYCKLFGGRQNATRADTATRCFGMPTYIYHPDHIVRSLTLFFPLLSIFSNPASKPWCTLVSAPNGKASTTKSW
jgi:hypothetical protein